MKNLLSTSFFLLISVFQLWAQDGLVVTNNAKKSIQHAQDFIHRGKYQDALKQLNHTLKIKEDFAIAHLELGRVYLELKQYGLSVTSFQRSFELNPNLSRAAYYEASEASFQSGEINQASIYLEQFRSMKNGQYANAGKEDPTENLYEVLYHERKTSQQYLLAGNYPKFEYTPFKNMGKLINGPTDEYLPTLTADGKVLVFTRTKFNGNQDVMLSYKIGEEWQMPEYFDQSINTSENEGMARFSADNTTLYFAGCLREDTEGGCDLYQARYIHGKVDQIERIEGNLNSKSWDSQPSITCDGNVLYFSSTREGGYGSADIYFSERLPNGKWGVPQNFGPEFNTIGDEEAPFISSDGKTLYYTSTGLPGMGDGDIFITRLEKGKWTKPQNMGLPINSQGKELGFYIQADGKTANFSSAREGGEGGMDLYEVELPPAFQPRSIVHVEGYVYDQESQLPLSCEVDIIRAEYKYKVKSDETGRFFICLPADKAFSFQTQPDGYDYHISAEFFESTDNRQSHHLEMALLPTKSAVKAKPVKLTQKREIKERRVQFFFPFDSFELTEDTESDLNKLINLLSQETWWNVEVIGLADNSGSAEYNQQLSEKRAKSIADYLQKSGIQTDQVFKKGNGSQGSGKLSRRVDVRLYR